MPMGRILFAWELGMNLGHLACIQPLALRCTAQGHRVLVAVRDTRAAKLFFGNCGITFVQGPSLARELRLGHRLAGYADILLAQGWGNASILRQLVGAWHELFKAFRPNVVVLDHAPTTQLAAHIASIPTVAIGNGFELPPMSIPLPPFPGFSWATREGAERSEATALTSVNAIMRELDRPKLYALREAFEGQRRLYATLPQLDHYGPRAGVTYTGPLLTWTGTDQVDWPVGSGTRMFAYLRPEMSSARAILEALKFIGARVICFAPGFDPDELESIAGPRIRVVSTPVDLRPLVATADGCISYSAVGTAFRFLFAGVPLLLAPKTIEAQMAARRIEDLGAGLVLRGPQTARNIAMLLERLVTEAHYRTRAQEFACYHKNVSSDAVTKKIVGVISEGLVGSPQ